nr:DUF3047 domain-containing protein [Oceanicoccus sp. KOV_DT_Chl]
MKIFSLLLCCCCVSSVAEDLIVSDFAAEGLAPFSEKRFESKTDYSLVSVDGRTVLKASAQASASALFREIAIDLEQTPFCIGSGELKIFTTLPIKPSSRVMIIPRESMWWLGKAFFLGKLLH